jgi:hypothetical protein
VAKSPVDHIPAGGLVLNAQNMTGCPAFRLVCANCNTIGIVLDYVEGASSSTPIFCRGCGALRGTLGALRNLSLPDNRDIFDVNE